MIVEGRDFEAQKSSLYEVTVGAASPTVLLAADDASFLFPTMSPKRDTFTFLTGASTEGPFIPCIGTFAGGPAEPLLRDGSACTYSQRPGFNPTADQVALVCWQEGGIQYLYVMALADRTLVRLDTGSLRPTGDPTWISPTEIAFLARSPESETKRIYRIDTRPNNSPALVDEPRARGISDDRPDWSDEGGLLFLRSIDARNEGRLVVKRTLTDEESTVLSTKGGSVKAFSWAPNDTGIVLTRNDRAGGYDLITLHESAPGVGDWENASLPWPDGIGEPWSLAWGSH